MFALDLQDLTALVKQTTGAEPLAIEPMPGGASSRKFFRVRLAPEPHSAVAMFVPDLDKSDEIAKQAANRRWAFLEVRDLLEAHNVRVPKLLADGTEKGWTVVEDLGDYTLAAFLKKHPAQKTQVYQTAVRDLARAQKALQKLPPESVICSRAFDKDLLRWELDHFREWALDAQGHPLPASERRQFDAIADRLAHQIASYPRGFVHRDYQSRNLMVLQENPELLAWVDFQDALLGPQVYDLVALLNDSYQSFDRAFVEARLDEYASERGLDAQGRKLLGRHFDRVTVQRKLKDAGRFVFIDRVKHDPSFLPFVQPTLAKVRASLERLTDEPDMAKLLTILEPDLPWAEDAEQMPDSVPVASSGADWN